MFEEQIGENLDVGDPRFRSTLSLDDAIGEDAKNGYQHPFYGITDDDISVLMLAG